MAGVAEAWSDVNHFETEIFGTRVDVWGESRHVSRHLVRGNGAPAQAAAKASFVELGLSADNRVSQVVAVNHPGDRDSLKELVRRRLDVTGREEQFKDPATSIAQLIG